MFEIIENKKLLSGLLLIAVIGDFVVPYVLALFYRDYKHTTMVMSSLGNPKSPVRGIYNIWLVILGVLLIISCNLIKLRYYSVSKGYSVATIILILTFAIGAGIISGIFSVNESKEVVTMASKVHGVFSAMGFMFLLFVSLLLAILSIKNGDKIIGIFFIVCFVLALIFFVLFVLADKPEFQDTIIAYEGIWQRLTLLFMYVPLGFIAITELFSTKLANSCQ